MTGSSERSPVAQIAMALSLANLAVIIAGVLWLQDVFQEAARDDKEVLATLKTRAGALLESVVSVGGVVVVAAVICGLVALMSFYGRASRQAALRRQSDELNSYLKNLSRARKRQGQGSSSSP